MTYWSRRKRNRLVLQLYTNRSVHPVVILLHQTPGSQLLRLQKQLRDELAKCSAAVFMGDDTAILENVQRKVQSIHSELLSTSSICQKEEELPILKNLMKEVSEYQRKSKVIARANQLTHRCKKLKRKSNTGCPIQTKPLRLKDDPLSAACKMPKFKAEDIAHILSCTGRKVKKMLQDGNCLFRSLSFCLHHSQDRYLEIRKTLVQFVERNGNNYKHLLFGRTLSEHLECTKKRYSAWTSSCCRLL